MFLPPQCWDIMVLMACLGECTLSSKDCNCCTTSTKRHIAAVLYALRGVEILHEGTGPMSRDTMMYVFSQYLLLMVNK